MAPGPSMSAIVRVSPGLILMDIGLPGMDGLEATRRLKQNPATQTIPVIAFSAHDRDQDRQQALAAGCATLIAKPIRLKNFLETIGAYLPPPTPETGAAGTTVTR